MYEKPMTSSQQPGNVDQQQIASSDTAAAPRLSGPGGVCPSVVVSTAAQMNYAIHPPFTSMPSYANISPMIPTTQPGVSSAPMPMGYGYSPIMYPNISPQQLYTPGAPTLMPGMNYMMSPGVIGRPLMPYPYGVSLPTTGHEGGHPTEGSSMASGMRMTLPTAMMQPPRVQIIGPTPNGTPAMFYPHMPPPASHPQIHLPRMPVFMPPNPLSTASSPFVTARSNASTSSLYSQTPSNVALSDVVPVHSTRRRTSSSGFEEPEVLTAKNDSEDTHYMSDEEEEESPLVRGRDEFYDVISDPENFTPSGTESNSQLAELYRDQVAQGVWPVVDFDPRQLQRLTREEFNKIVSYQQAIMKLLRRQDSADTPNDEENLSSDTTTDFVSLLSRDLAPAGLSRGTGPPSPPAAKADPSATIRYDAPDEASVSSDGNNPNMDAPQKKGRFKIQLVAATKATVSQDVLPSNQTESTQAVNVQGATEPQTQPRKLSGVNMVASKGGPRFRKTRLEETFEMWEHNGICVRDIRSKNPDSNLLKLAKRSLHQVLSEMDAKVQCSLCNETQNGHQLDKHLKCDHKKDFMPHVDTNLLPKACFWSHGQRHDLVAAMNVLAPYDLSSCEPLPTIRGRFGGGQELSEGKENVTIAGANSKSILVTSESYSSLISLSPREENNAATVATTSCLRRTQQMESECAPRAYHCHVNVPTLTGEGELRLRSSDTGGGGGGRISDGMPHDPRFYPLNLLCHQSLPQGHHLQHYHSASSTPPRRYRTGEPHHRTPLPSTTESSTGAENQSNVTPESGVNLVRLVHPSACEGAALRRGSAGWNYPPPPGSPVMKGQMLELPEEELVNMVEGVVLNPALERFHSLEKESAESQQTASPKSMIEVLTDTVVETHLETSSDRERLTEDMFRLEERLIQSLEDSKASLLNFFREELDRTKMQINYLLEQNRLQQQHFDHIFVALRQYNNAGEDTPTGGIEEHVESVDSRSASFHQFPYTVSSSLPTFGSPPGRRMEPQPVSFPIPGAYHSMGNPVPFTVAWSLQSEAPLLSPAAHATAPPSSTLFTYPVAPMTQSKFAPPEQQPMMSPQQIHLHHALVANPSYTSGMHLNANKGN